jgi:ketosteroid isomerase-like protein
MLGECVVNRIVQYGFGLFSLLNCSPILADENQCSETFDSVVAQNVQAIQSRDLPRYMQTLAPREAHLMILPNGARLRSRAAIESMHRDWFADASWTFNAKEIHRDVRSEWGLVVFEVSVDRPDKPGVPFILSMLFAPEADGCWYLQHDQNTLLPVN